MATASEMINITAEACAIIVIKCAGFCCVNEYVNDKATNTVAHFAASKTASALLGAHTMDTACKITKRANAIVPIVMGRLFFQYCRPNINAISSAVAATVKRTMLDMSARRGENDSVAKHTNRPKTKR